MEDGELQWLHSRPDGVLSVSECGSRAFAYPETISDDVEGLQQRAMSERAAIEVRSLGIVPLQLLIRSRVSSSKTSRLPTNAGPGRRRRVGIQTASRAAGPE